MSVWSVRIKCKDVECGHSWITVAIDTGGKIQLNDEDEECRKCSSRDLTITHGFRAGAPRRYQVEDPRKDCQCATHRALREMVR